MLTQPPGTPRLTETRGEMILRSLLNLIFHAEEQLGLWRVRDEASCTGQIMTRLLI